MNPKLHHLARRGSIGTWHVVKAIPAPLRHAFPGKDGKPRHHLIRSLGTTDPEKAVFLRAGVLQEFDMELARARDPAAADELLKEANGLRQAYRRLQNGDKSGWSVGVPDAELPVLEDIIENRADEIAGTHSPAVAQTFFNVAMGTGTPLRMHLEDWLREPGSKGPLTERTKAQRRAIVEKLETWLAARRSPLTVEAVTKPVAGAFITSTITNPGIDAVTGNSRISALSSYWRWLLKRTGTTVNPWKEQSLRKPSKRNGQKPKRPFTDAELLTLLTGPASQEQLDVIKIAALTGMRRSEIFVLQIADCRDGLFNITASKSEAGVRCFPQHSDLMPIVARLTAGRKPSDHLIPGSGKNRADAYGKWFTRYRRELDVDGQMDGKRHSRIDFHSLRRWFTTKARNAGFDRATVAAIVGHEVGNLTDDVYSAGPDMGMKRACIESVKLPE